MDDEDPDWRKDVMLARSPDAAPDAWMLVDLRKLRAAGLASVPAGWRDLALGYDIAILAPTFSASSVLGVPEATAP
jgi:hypothetical protein